MFELWLIGIAGFTLWTSIVAALTDQEVPDAVRNSFMHRTCGCGKELIFVVRSSLETVKCDQKDGGCGRVHLAAWYNGKPQWKTVNECSKCKSVIPIHLGKYIHIDPKCGSRFLVICSNPKLTIARLPTDMKLRLVKTLLIELKEKFW